MEEQLVKSYNFGLNLNGIDIAIVIGVLVLFYLIQDYYGWKYRDNERKKKREAKYFIAKNRAQLMSEITIGLKIISNLKTLIYLNKLTDDYLDKSIKRLEKIVLCYDSHHGIEVLGKIHKSRNNKDMLKISLSLLELEFNKV